MNFIQKTLTLILLILTGMMAGALLMLYSGKLNPHENVEVRISEITRNMDGPAVDTHLFQSEHDNWIKNIAKEVTSSVVYIETEMPARRQSVPDDGNHDFEERFWERLLPQQRIQSIGSGVIISSDGYILTNNHVIGRNARTVRVGLDDKRYYEARIIGRDPSTDLAVLKIDAGEIKPIIIGNSDMLDVGDWVMAVGNPFRLKSTVTAGIVSALNRDVDIIRDRMRIETFIQTDAAINRGNSGGALVNVAGELIGINTAIATESGGYQGYGFAIPINMAFKIAMDLIEFGEVRRPYLGVQIAAVEQGRARQLGMERIQGVEVLDVARNGSADRAGLRRNDVILEVNGISVNEANALQERIALLRPQDEVELSLWRNGEIISMNIHLMGMQDEEIRSWALNEPAGQNDAEESEIYWRDFTESGQRVREFSLGFSIFEYPGPDDPEQLELGVYEIKEDSHANDAGLKKEDTILEINEIPVASMRDFSIRFIEMYRAEQNITITVKRGNGLETIEMYP